MNERENHPEMLETFVAGRPGRVQVWGGLWLAAGLLLFVGDWAARFGMFRWQDVWRPPSGPVAAAAIPTEARARTLPAQTGAGLTQMLPFPGMAARYAEFHPETVQPRDPWGYFNASTPEESYCPIVMVGDSFMVSLGTQTVAQALAAAGTVRVYNHARPGSGPFLELRRFIASDRFDPPPQVVVWNLTARELGAPLFERQAVAAWFDRSMTVAAGPRTGGGRILWDQLTPSALRRAWPNTSLAAYFSRKAWRQIKLLAFREWPAEVLGADDPEFGPMLFYGENLRVLPLLGPETDASAVMRTVEHVARGLRDRGTALVVLLVPEKEQVHAEALPVRHRRALADSTDLLDAIAAGLSEAGVPVVHLMPVFRGATETGQRLYWRDDTHWNDAGIRLAAEELWREVEPLLEENQESISNIQHPISSAAEPQPK